jgi:hypothetical protein
LHDLAADPVANVRVHFYLQVDAQIERGRDVLDLERQWNPIGLQQV